MKTGRGSVRLVMVMVLTAATVLPASALELEFGGFFGNLGLPWAQDTPITTSQYPSTNWLYGGLASFTNDFGQGFELTIEYETDTVLRHIVRGVVTYENGMASLSAGPMVGVFNSPTSPLKAGIDIGFRLEVPGLAFFSAVVESSMGAGLAAVGDYAQERSEIVAGWYALNAICSFSMETRRYAKVLADDQWLVDAATDYLFSVDVFKKGVPYRVLADLGYRAMTRTYADDTVDGLGAIILGAEISATVSDMVSLRVSLDSGVYVFGLEEMVGRGPAPDAFMFSGNLAAILRL